MSAPAARKVPYQRQVFLNVPYDDAFLPIFRSLIFAVHACEFSACYAAMEVGNERLRLAKIFAYVRGSKLSIHDISRVNVTPGELPRFNMPYELGVFAGAREFGAGRHRDKAYLVLDNVPYQYQKSLSDIAGMDPKHHGNDPDQAAESVRAFLADHIVPRPVGAKEIRKLRTAFEAELPDIARKAGIALTEINSFEYLVDWHSAAASWLANKAA